MHTHLKSMSLLILELDVVHFFQDGETPAFCAAKNSDTECCTALIAAGANVNLQNNVCFTFNINNKSATPLISVLYVFSVVDFFQDGDTLALCAAKFDSRFPSKFYAVEDLTSKHGLLAVPRTTT